MAAIIYEMERNEYKRKRKKRKGGKGEATEV
jgi:hypothetical protein